MTTQAKHLDHILEELVTDERIPIDAKLEIAKEHLTRLSVQRYNSRLVLYIRDGMMTPDEIDKLNKDIFQCSITISAIDKVMLAIEVSRKAHNNGRNNTE